MPGNTRSQIVLVLCGLVGSGKSTFANALQACYPEFVRCNQDELGNRRAVESRTHDALLRGKSVIVDRTNIDKSQRRTWVNIARQYEGAEIWAVLMGTPYMMCAERLRTRTDHPTLPPEQALSVLRNFSSTFVPPDSSEGFDRLLTLEPHPSPTYSKDDLEEILIKVRLSDATTLALASNAPAPSSAPYNSRERLWTRGPSSRGRSGPSFPSWRGRESQTLRGSEKWREDGSANNSFRSSSSSHRHLPYDRPLPHHAISSSSSSSALSPSSQKPTPPNAPI